MGNFSIVSSRFGTKHKEHFYHDLFCLEHLSLKVLNVEFDYNVSVDSRHCLTDTLKSNSTLGSHLHAMVRTHHFDFDIRF